MVAITDAPEDPEVGARLDEDWCIAQPIPDVEGNAGVRQEQHRHRNVEALLEPASLLFERGRIVRRILDLRHDHTCRERERLPGGAKQRLVDPLQRETSDDQHHRDHGDDADVDS